MLYRLFAPMFVVVLIVGGVGLSSELVKNSKERQSALSVAYADGACPQNGTIVVQDSMCKARDPFTGKVLPNPCYAETPKSGTIEGVCMDFQGTGCCMATSWVDAQTSTKMQLKDLLGDNFLSDTIKGLIGQIGGGGGGYGGTGDGRERPRCTSISKSPNLPLRPGESATISWVSSGGLAEVTTVMPSVGIVRGTSVQVSPSESTTYTVTLKNSKGEAKCAPVRVYVGPDNPTDDESTSDVSTGVTDDYGVDIWSDNSDSLQDTGPLYDDDTSSYLDSITSDNDSDTPTDGSTNVPGVITGGDVYSEVNINNNTNRRQNPQNVNSINKDDWYDYTDRNLYNSGGDYNINTKDIRRDTNGLTDQEIYGVWSRPQSPTTGGLGLGGGYIDGNSIETSGGETPGVFTRIGKWVKEALCFWCDTNTSMPINNSAVTAAALKSLSVASNEVINDAAVGECTTEIADTGIFVDPDQVYREACTPDMTEQECKESWAGKKVNLSWGVQCGNTCTLSTQDSQLRSKLNSNGSLKGIANDTTEFKLNCVNTIGEESVYISTVNVLQK